MGRTYHKSENVDPEWTKPRYSLVKLVYLKEKKILWAAKPKLKLKQTNNKQTYDCKSKKKKKLSKNSIGNGSVNMSSWGISSWIYISPNSAHLKDLNTVTNPEKVKTLSAQILILNTIFH